MSGDIVNRLHAASGMGVDETIGDVLCEAADEIERMRASLAEAWEKRDRANKRFLDLCRLYTVQEAALKTARARIGEGSV